MTINMENSGTANITPYGDLTISEDNPRDPIDTRCVQCMWMVHGNHSSTSGSKIHPTLKCSSKNKVLLFHWWWVYYDIAVNHVAMWWESSTWQALPTYDINMWQCYDGVYIDCILEEVLNCMQHCPFTNFDKINVVTIFGPSTNVMHMYTYHSTIFHQIWLNQIWYGKYILY